ncbi:flagella biosynthesis regulator Flk [Pectobacterium versatile]|uniref:flagella biosynthesis regulator Flk n=1 Tax=Pectobacterium versatile TaxID=2488639 RepID=UPI00102EC59F|nr:MULTISPECIES: flagella biosynthesis regulator Flk [Pectobacterium]MBQ4788197.1 flagella biosynthesis regulator Flk [Pectobacterium versatile]MCA5929879.1 flagella biosynthesis regulator Flk [Pectobacterium versatile]MCA5947075.1 flagella biosynthesis regulator Flk [Pectobacterium versatile]MCA5951637.1 flagella biosynthesis regulator Flk [Pectobacterium versatile]MCL6364006.1 flagella biosynthesis regulator Flk [Pectobacterium carotovorum subsp. carotovorum]
MQPVSGPGAPLPGERSVTPTTTSSTSTSSANAAGSANGDRPLTLAQRTTLENLVLKVAALTTSKAAEVWTTVKQGLGLAENNELLSRHYQPAEQILQTRLTQAQDSGGRQQLLQRLTDMLSQGNNRQAVSNFIQQQFGSTTLSALNKTQLQQVVTLLQSGQIPQSTAPATASQTTQAANSPDRPLSPAEQRGLNQLVTRLATMTGEQPARVLNNLMMMQNLSPGDAIPLKHLPLITQFLQAQVELQQTQTLLRATSPAPQGTPTNAGTTGAASEPLTANTTNTANANPSSTANLSSQPLSAQNALLSPNLAPLQALLQQPMTAQEQHLLMDYTQNRFNIGLQTPLTPMQVSDLLTFLFTQRIQRSQETDWTTTSQLLHPLFNPLIASLPLSWQSLFHKPMFLVIVSTCVAAFLLWVLI